MLFRTFMAVLASAALGGALSVFAGSAYLVLVPALLNWAVVLKLTSAARRHDSVSERLYPWPPWHFLTLLFFALLWTGLTVIAFLFANVRLASFL